MDKPKARTCHKCGKPKGCFSFVYTEAGTARRAYFHPDCFRDFKEGLLAAGEG